MVTVSPFQNVRCLLFIRIGYLALNSGDFWLYSFDTSPMFTHAYNDDPIQLPLCLLQCQHASQPRRRHSRPTTKRMLSHGWCQYMGLGCLLDDLLSLSFFGTSCLRKHITGCPLAHKRNKLYSVYRQFSSGHLASEKDPIQGLRWGENWLVSSWVPQEPPGARWDNRLSFHRSEPFAN